MARVRIASIVAATCVLSLAACAGPSGSEAPGGPDRELTTTPVPHAPAHPDRDRGDIVPDRPQEPDRDRDDGSDDRVGEDRGTDDEDGPPREYHEAPPPGPPDR